MTGTPSRVERRRQATLDEVVAAARALLKDDEEVTVSSVAAALGLTPPALYRYITNLAGLQDLLARSILESLHARIYAAAERYHDPPARLVAAATAFRQWALFNPGEFRTVFRPRAPLVKHECVEELSASEIANTLFFELAMEVLKGRPQAPNPDQFEPTSFLQQFDEGKARCGYPEEMNGWVLWQFQRMWVKFLGIIAYETYGFLHPGVIISGDLCVSIMIEIGKDLGLGEDTERLLAVAVETADWASRIDGQPPLSAFS